MQKNWLRLLTNVWVALKNKDAHAVGSALMDSFNAQVAMFPNMISEDIIQQIDSFKKDVLGWEISGAGGGGYLILFSGKPINNAI